MVKKGVGHIEMIFSFIFFAGFVFFLFLTLKPYDTKVLPQSVNRALVNSFEQNALTNLTILSIKVDFPEGWNNDCFSAELPKKSNLMFGFTNSHVEDLNGRVDSGLNSGGKLEIKSRENFFRVFISPEFESGNVNGCKKIEKENYELGSILEKKVLSYNYLTAIRDKYENNYEDFKEEIGVPRIFDFAIVYEDLPEISIDRETPSSGEIFAESYIFEVLKSDGNITNTKFTVKIW